MLAARSQQVLHIRGESKKSIARRGGSMQVKDPPWL